LRTISAVMRQYCWAQATSLPARSCSLELRTQLKAQLVQHISRRRLTALRDALEHDSSDMLTTVG